MAAATTNASSLAKFKLVSRQALSCPSSLCMSSIACGLTQILLVLRSFLGIKVLARPASSLASCMISSTTRTRYVSLHAHSARGRDACRMQVNPLGLFSSCPVRCHFCTKAEVKGKCLSFTNICTDPLLCTPCPGHHRNRFPLKNHVPGGPHCAPTALVRSWASAMRLAAI